jgi:ABC-type multidrug transport system fused ATPase/permease subunit
VELQVRLVAQIAVVLFVGVALDDDGRIVLRLDRSTRCGSVLIDGRDVRGITGPSLRKQLACVTQENFLFAGRVLDNLRVGRPGASEDEVRAAARALNMLDVLETLPAGLATDVGEGGPACRWASAKWLSCARHVRRPAHLVIAHRASTIRHADKIVTLDHGRIVEPR